MTATEKLQKKTNDAFSQRKKDGDDVKAVGGEYAEQVKELARGAINTAQVCL